MAAQPFCFSRQAGFTLIELVTSMVIMGIIGVGFSQLFIDQLQHYLSAQARLELVGSARNTMTRMGLELQGAVHDSVRVDNNGQCLAFKARDFSTRHVSYIRYCLQAESLRRFEQDNADHLATGSIGNGILMMEHVNNSARKTPVFQLQTTSDASLALLTMTLIMTAKAETLTLDHAEIIRYEQ